MSAPPFRSPLSERARKMLACAQEIVKQRQEGNSFDKFTPDHPLVEKLAQQIGQEKAESVFHIKLQKRAEIAAKRREAVRQLSKEGVSRNQIASLIGVTPHYVSQIRSELGIAKTRRKK